MNHKPRILIASGGADPNPASDPYAQAILRAGGEPVLRWCPAPDLSCDALLLTGGGDVAPDRYGEEPDGSGEPDLLRDEAEFILADAFFGAKKPIFGICRGHQLLHIFMGGKLTQHIGDALCRAHTRTSELPEEKWHPILIRSGACFPDTWQSGCVVNSTHHQALRRAGDTVRITATAPDGIVEAAEGKYDPVYGVQFHPERMKERGDELFRLWLSLC